jgi:hypothetical protein
MVVIFLPQTFSDLNMTSHRSKNPLRSLRRVLKKIRKVFGKKKAAPIDAAQAQTLTVQYKLEPECTA